MASPDFSDYVDLTINDLDVQEIYDEAVIYAQTNLPEFNPRVGTIENAMLEAVSYTTRNLVSAINTLPNSLLEGLIKLMGFSRNEATTAKGTVLIELIINTGATIVAGTVFSFNVFDSEGVLTQFLFETQDDLIIVAPNTSGTAAVVASEASAYPEIAVPAGLTVVSSTPFILSATLQTLTSVGTDTELDSEYFDRASSFLKSLSNTIATASQLINYLLVTYPTVGRFKVYDLTKAQENKISNIALTSNVATITTSSAHGYSVGDSVLVSDLANTVFNGTYTITVVPSTTTFRYAKTNANIGSTAVTVGTVILASGMLFATADVSGAVTISLCDSVGAQISETQKSIIKTDVESKLVAGLKVGLHNMNTFLVDVACSVTVDSNYSTATVGLAVSEAIDNYLSISGWDFSESINSLYLVTLASKVPGVKYVSTLDATLNGSTNLASNSGNDVTVLRKGSIPIGTTTTIATS